MSAPSWLTASLVALMIATALFHVGRMVATRRLRRPHDYDVDAAHAVMGVAMVVMLVEPRAPGILARTALVVAVPTAWFSCQAVRRYVLHGGRAGSQPARQALGAAAMLYLLALGAAGHAPPAGLPGGAMPAMSMPSGPGSGIRAGMQVMVPLVMLVVGALVVWTTAQICRTARVHRAAGQAGEVLAPALSNGCQLAMTVTSGYMLVAML